MQFKESSDKVYQTFGFFMHNRTSTIDKHTASSIYFLFDFEGVIQVYSAAGPGALHILVHCCAIIGGVFVVLGLLNTVLLRVLV